MHIPGFGHCSVDCGGVNPNGTMSQIGLTIGPLGGFTVAPAPASQPDLARLDGGCQQKNGWENPRSTVLPPSQASVNPMLIQRSPPNWHGSAVLVAGLA
jgi:hypothetical protein